MLHFPGGALLKKIKSHIKEVICLIFAKVDCNCIIIREEDAGASSCLLLKTTLVIGAIVDFVLYEH